MKEEKETASMSKKDRLNEVKEKMMMTKGKKKKPMDALDKVKMKYMAKA